MRKSRAHLTKGHYLKIENFPRRNSNCKQMTNLINKINAYKKINKSVS